MRAPGRTLMSRIVWTTSVVTAVAMGAMIGTVLLVLSRLTDNSIDARLRDQLAAISATVKVAPDGSITALETPDDSIDDTTWVFDAAGNRVEGPSAGPRVTAFVTSLAGVRTTTQATRLERAFLAAPVRVGGTVRAVVVVETPLKPYEATRDAVLIGLLGLGVTVTAGSAAIAAWTVRRTLGPVESMASRAEDWSEHDLDARFEATGTDDEFARLGRTLNILLDRVAGALRGEQQLTAELAHELRTPLSAIRGEAELAMMSDVDPQATERLHRIVDVVDRMSATISSLLAIARGEHRSDARTTALELVTATLGHGSLRPEIRVDTSDVTDVEIAAPLDLAVRALSPVVENAFAHAGAAVTISTHSTDRIVSISVSDDGTGITATDSEAVFESGRRGADSHGAGLGLTLSRRVARTLGGDVHVTSTGEPTTVTVSYPRY